MFESAEIGHTIDKQTYNEAVPVLREALLAAQYRLREQARFPVLILINGLHKPSDFFSKSVAGRNSQYSFRIF